MYPTAIWKREYVNEIQHAISAREKSNEGMARVCARRAAGIIIGEYLSRRGHTNLSGSTFDRLSIFVSLPEVEDQYRDIASHFLMKVNPDHNLPVDADLIRDAQWLAKNLLLENIP
ncbi:MAG: hypothetical protein A2Y53_07340 [Chloroflexi bacterium RBG_16_47_49]|nr:MAG: hypothetical protein A2Y53_07340 [Chloroflexi bacterium RBG_16_47_49]